VSKVTIVDDKSWAWLLTKHADIRNVLSDNEHFSKVRTRPNFPELSKGGRLAAMSHKPTFVDMDPPEHTCQRAMVSPTFSSNHVAEMTPMIQEIVNQQINVFMTQTAPSSDLVANFALPMASNVMYRILGIPSTDMAYLSQCNAVRTNGSATATQASAANAELVAYLKQLIESKAKNLTADTNLINTLIKEQLQPQKIALDDLVQVVFLMLVAGNATMVSMIALGVSTLLQHPKQLAELRADPSLYRNAMVELCRYHTASALATRRIAIKDVTVGGTLIKAGEGVIAATQSGNRDESAFPQPDMFDIHRHFDDSAHKSLAYGHAEHECVAEWLALTELEVALRSLFEAMPKLRLAVEVKDIKYSAPEADVGILELPVVWK